MSATISSFGITRHAVSGVIRHSIVILAMLVTPMLSSAEGEELGITAPGEAVPGGQAPDFQLRDLEQNLVRLAELRCKPVVLNFFASWCGPCLKELPLIQAAYLDSEQDGFLVLGVGYQDSRWAIESLADDVGLTFPIVIDGDNSVGQAYRVVGPPYTFFIDANGVVVEVVAGAMERQTLQRNLDKLLKVNRI